MTFRVVVSLATLAVCAAPEPLHANEVVWLVGGGYEPHASQAQIELNVRWIQEVIRRRASKARLLTYFTSGGERDVVDVKRYERVQNATTAYHALARVFGAHIENGETFFRSGVVSNGTTRADFLRDELSREILTLQPVDRFFFIYNGHGDFDGEDVFNNSLKLWEDTRLTANELAEILEPIPKDTLTRFFFPQCFAGGFERVMLADPNDTMAITSKNRCAFFAERAHHEAEGCTPSINIGEYRDYSAYFFAALDGQRRDSSPIPKSVDRNQDGMISLREAHLYGVVAAMTDDMPYTSSEAFLEAWEPWFLRWLPGLSEPQNTYTTVANELALLLTLPLGRDGVTDAIRRHARLSEKLGGLDDERVSLEERAADLGTEIGARLARRWPAIHQPYTTKFHQFWTHEAGAAEQMAQSDASYGELVMVLDRLEAMDDEELMLSREATTILRYLRARRLARLVVDLERYGSEEDQATYQRLVACEESGL